MKKLSSLVLVAAFAAVGLAGCTPEKAMNAANNGPSATAAPPPPPPPVVAASASAMPAKMEFSENDFAESDRNRDPFRSYAAVVGPQQTKVIKTQHEAILSQFSIEELKLVAIVTGGEYNRAMVVDPGGKGWVLKKGDWVGRPEVVHIGGANGADYQITWRVDKVREGDIVFLRSDPAQPAIPPATKVIALRTEEQANREKL